MGEFLLHNLKKLTLAIMFSWNFHLNLFFIPCNVAKRIATSRNFFVFSEQFVLKFVLQWLYFYEVILIKKVLSTADTKKKQINISNKVRF